MSDDPHHIHIMGMMDSVGVAKRIVLAMNQSDSASEALGKAIAERDGLELAAKIADEIFLELDRHLQGKCPNGDVDACVENLRVLVRHYQSERRQMGAKP